MRLTALLLFASLLNAATVTVCSSGCTTTSLQTALNTTAACGDTIQIKSSEKQTGNFTITYRGCGANPITVTSDRAAWLPTAGARVSPSHLANMAQIVTNNSAPALADALDAMSRPPAGWVFVGVAFSTTTYTYNVVAFNSNGTAANASQIPDNITFDRCYFFQPSAYAGEALQNVIRGDATNLTVKNSFFGDGFMSGVESHGIGILTNAGPVTITNNFVTTSSIPVFVGGYTPSYPAYLANGMTVNYNYFWRPWKWNSDPAQPYYADYVTASTSNPFVVCSKNLGELKWGVGVTWQYNVAENSWYASQCGSQFNGFTDTLRTNNDTTAGPFLNSNIGTFSMSDTTHVTWTGTYRIGNIGAGSRAFSTNTQDLGICIQLPTTGRECHGITSYTGASLVAASAFSAAPAGALNGEFVYSASAQLKSLTVQNNVWKNVDLAASTLGVAGSNGAGDDGYGKTVTFAQNLWYSNTSYIGPHATGFLVSGGDFFYANHPSGYTYNHNTFYYPTGMPTGNFVYVLSNQSGTETKFDTSAFTNNLFGVSASGPNGAFGGDAVGTVGDVANRYYTNSNFKNNGIPGSSDGSAATGGNVVSGNIYTTWADPFGGLGPTTPVQMASAYYHAGLDGASLGVDVTQLPLVRNVAVTGAVLSFDTSLNNSDIKALQPCTLEVSPSRNLTSDLGTYTVIASLDPTLAIGADLSTRLDVGYVGSHVTWPLTGVVVGTPYYGRLMCAGDTEWFSFVGAATPGKGSMSGKSVISSKAVN